MSLSLEMTQSLFTQVVVPCCLWMAYLHLYHHSYSPLGQRCWQIDSGAASNNNYPVLNREGSPKSPWLVDDQCPINTLPGLAPQSPHINFLPSTSLNPATLQPNPDSDIIHNCTEILHQIHGVWLKLTDIPWPHPDLTYSMFGSSFTREGTRHAGAAVATLTETILLSGT